METIELDFLEKNDVGLSPGLSIFMSECLQFCLTSQAHRPGVIMKVTINENEEEEIALFWQKGITTLDKYSMNDEQRTTEFGAMGASLLLIQILTNYKFFVTSSKGTGFDFWLFEEEPDELDYTKASARLEISGIRKATEINNIARRLKIKEKQVNRYDFNYPQISAYFSIIEFSKPESVFLCH